MQRVRDGIVWPGWPDDFVKKIVAQAVFSQN
jgi:hypothetical protein